MAIYHTRGNRIRMSNLVVLIVDDHPLVISGCQSLLAQDGSIKVISASDQKSGYQSFMDNRPDVTVVDINLPDLSGFELLRRIRKENADAGVIVLSMNDEPTFVVRAVELGARGFVSKNDDPRLLLKAVRTVAKGESFIASGRAQEIAFASSAIRSHPASQLSARELETPAYPECRAHAGCPGGKAVVFCAVPGLDHWVWDEGASASWTFFQRAR